ncbi:MAG: hypothetical protein QNL61_06055 [Crocinitomicaceae bacterium]
MQKLTIILFFLFVCSRALSQDTTDYKRLKVLPLPAFGYAPETSGSIGALCLFSFNIYNDSNTRLSNAKIEFNYTLNKQIIFENVWSYFFKDEKWFTDGIVHYSIYPDFYYGIGPRTPQSNNVLFNSNRFVFQGNVYKKIGNQLFSGINLKYIDYSNVQNKDSIQYSELTSSRLMGFGLSVLKDTRNNILTPIDGWFLKGSAGYNFSKSNYFEAAIDGRYCKTWRSLFTLAGRFYNRITAGTPSFYDYSIMGGDNIARGYRYGRFRDKNITTLQSEFRAHLFWRIGMAAFAGVTNVYPTISKFDFRAYKVNVGIGLRILVDKKDNTSLRLDYAIGENGNNGFYVSFGESF